MKNFWVKKWAGHVEIKTVGKGSIRLINQLVRENINVWNVTKHDEDTVTFHMFIQDIRALRKAAKDHSVKVRFAKRSGLPFIWKDLMKNFGLVAGALLAIVAILILSNMIWKIEIKGASPETEYKITNQLKEMGVRIGQLQFFIDDPETIQQKITHMNENITWIGVDVKGTTYHFQVVEKEQPDKPKATSPRDLVAKKEAVIVDYFVEKGKPMIAINDYVKPGQILVAGDIGKEDAPNIISAKGVVYGKTWYKTETEMELKSVIPVLTGEEKNKKGIKIGNLYIPLWGFGKVDYENKKVEEDETSLKFLKWTLPLSFVSTSIKEQEMHEKVYTEDEAKKIAKEISKKDLLQILPDDAVITGEKVLHENIDNGTLKVEIVYDVVENIVKEQPIITEN